MMARASIPNLLLPSTALNQCLPLYFIDFPTTGGMGSRAEAEVAAQVKTLLLAELLYLPGTENLGKRQNWALCPVDL